LSTLERTFVPPAEISREEIIASSNSVLARSDLPIQEREDVFRIQSLGLDWDIGVRTFEPQDSSRIPRGPDGKRIGLFLLHGGGGDFRGKTPMARLIASKLGWRVACMTYPGHLYFFDPKHDWPGDTINSDGSVRTPIWNKDQPITPDQYELIEDRSDPAKRAKWGTLFFLKAKEGTDFYNRMAAWPFAFEQAMQETCARSFPVDEFSVYVHGHSTGGPFVHMLLQRVENVVGLLGMESSPFGSIYGRMLGMSWDFPFNYLTVRTWRHIAKYAGSEAGPEGAWRLPWIMEDVLEAWDRSKTQPQIKSEYFITYGAMGPLGDAARAAARRLGLSQPETDALVRRYQSYPVPLEGEGARPLPPLLYAVAKGSRDHTVERYQKVVLPTLAAVNPPPRTSFTLFQAGVHGYEKTEDDLPRGVLPAVLQLWCDAIDGGYYL
jgi:hypothetical protein